jgi:hypothetical protein
LRELWSDKLIAILIKNPSKLHFGQEVLHVDLKGLGYELGDLDTLNPQIKEDIEFQRALVVKLSSGKFWLSGKLSHVALFGPLKQILLNIHKFCRFAHL